MKILVTGCMGFIASHFCKYVLKNTEHKVVGLARHSHKKNEMRLAGVLDHAYFQMYYMDLSDDNLTEVLEGVDVVINFAAKTFVDYSVRDPRPFIKSNIDGVYNLLEAVRKNPVKKFIQISTDEVYGPCLVGAHKEDAPMNPTNPYSATKAAAEMLCMGYAETYKIPMLITRTENNYGPYQHPQKVMPAFIKKALNKEHLPLYGDGKQKRMWLRAEDHCSALMLLIDKDATGIYNVAGSQELMNIELANIILNEMNLPLNYIKYIDDSKIRPSHDIRYAIDTTKITALGWKPKFSLEEGLRDSIQWYLNNQWWL